MRARDFAADYSADDARAYYATAAELFVTVCGARSVYTPVHGHERSGTYRTRRALGSDSGTRRLHGRIIKRAGRDDRSGSPRLSYNIKRVRVCVYVYIYMYRVADGETLIQYTHGRWKSF